MTTVSVRVEDDLKDRAEEAAAAEGLSVSEWTRQLMRGALGLDLPEYAAPSSLSKRDRRQLALLHRLVQLVTEDEDEASYHERMTEVLSRGYTGEYSDEFISIDDELSLDECRLVWDILDMFRVIEASVSKLGTPAVEALDEHALHALTFRGFDFNDGRESRMAGYAHHLIETDRWGELALYFDAEHERGNSHAPTLATYLRMLHTFKPLWESMIHGAGRGRYHLNRDELLAIIKSWYHQG